MNYLIQRTLENRGYTTDFLREINNPYYDELKDIDTLVVRLKEIHDEQIPITIFPDFDMDGICSGSGFFAGLAELGFRVNLFIPNPSEGYGITPKSVQDLMKQYPDTKVIITCDTGISGYEAADYCKEIGVEFIITDHHVQEKKANTDIIIDPMRSDEEYSHPQICGAFVVYQILQYYVDLYGNYFQQDQIRRLRVFAGIGTVSDTMPLLYENRQIVLDAIHIMRLVYGDGTFDAVMSIQGCDIYRRAFWGLFHAAKVCETYGIISSQEDIDEDFFGFYLAPIFNSAKRMNGSMTKTFGVFFANEPQVNMDYLYKLNAKRKELVAREVKKILEKDQPLAPYIYFTDADSGVLGLLAMKLMTITQVPTFVLTDDGENAEGNRYHGSGRAPEWYPCITRLSNFISIAGHEYAFGCGIEDKDRLDKFYAFLQVDAEKALSEAEIIEVVPDFVINTDWSEDTGIDVDLFMDYLSELNQLRPFGKGFPAPYVKFAFRNNDVIEWKTMGKAKQHLKIMFHNGFDCICWNQAHLINQKDSFENHVVMGHLELNEYNGLLSVNFVGDFQEQ